MKISGKCINVHFEISLLDILFYLTSGVSIETMVLELILRVFHLLYQLKSSQFIPSN